MVDLSKSDSILTNALARFPVIDVTNDTNAVLKSFYISIPRQLAFQ